MIFNSKVLVLALLASMVAASPGSVRRSLKVKAQDGKPIHVKYAKGENGDPDELGLEVKIVKCEEGSDACKKLKEDGKEVTERQFAKDFAGDMMAALEKDDEDKKQDGGDRRLSYCWYEYYCDCCYCYSYYSCY